MIPAPNQRLEKFRLMDLELQCWGNGALKLVGTTNGLFAAKFKGNILRMQAGTGDGWEHVSVSLEYRVPTWYEMCWVKELFWGDDECVMQLHVPKADWVNNHPYCLHLWKPIDLEIPRPPKDLV